MYENLVEALRLNVEYRQADNALANAARAADAIEALEAKLEVPPEVESFINNKADKIIENLQSLNNSIEQRSGWISVTERLPEAGERVLCCCRANIYEVMKMRTDGDWVYDTNHVYMHSFVTHWMPIPTPPKEET